MTRPADALEWMDDSTFAIEIGDGVWMQEITNDDGSLWGVITTHRCPNTQSGWNQGSAPIKGAGYPNGWEIEQRDPLTLKPSLQHLIYKNGTHTPDSCPRGHGFIRDGKWQS